MSISSNTTNRLGVVLFTICKSQLHVSATNIGHLRFVQWKNINQLYRPTFVAETRSRDLHI